MRWNRNGMLTPVLALLGRTFPRLRRAFWKGLYERLALDHDPEWAFMNYGFEDPDAPRLALDPADEPDRFGIQLYHHVATAVELEGKDVLEVGCGRGGGISYVARYLRPRTLIGVDLSPNAVALCRRRVSGGVLFACADAQALPFGAGQFDAVINVESSHCYPDIEAFTAEAYRILRPGGMLLYADLRFYDAVRRLRGQLSRPGFLVLRERDITRNVVLALRLDTLRRRAVIRRKVSAAIRRPFEAFAGATGTIFHEKLENGKGSYLSFVLQKPAPTLPQAGAFHA